jgi:RNA 3'-terminal phosphate cyclase (ATP)
MGPGNALTLTLEHEHIVEVFTAFGEKARTAESVAEAAAKDVREYLVHGAPVGKHLADQLLIPMALGGVSAFATQVPTAHFTSNAEVIARFTGRRVAVEERGDQHIVMSQ